MASACWLWLLVWGPAQHHLLDVAPVVLLPMGPRATGWVRLYRYHLVIDCMCL